MVRAKVFGVGLAVLLLTATALAQKPGWPKELVIAEVPVESAADYASRYAPFLDYLKGRLGIPVRLFLGTDYTAVMLAQAQGQVHVAFYGPASYVDAIEKAKAPIEAFVKEDSIRSGLFYYSLMISKKGSGIRTLQDARGKDFAFVDPESTSGYKVPMAYFCLEAKIRPREYFSRVFFAGTHENVILGVARAPSPWASLGTRGFPSPRPRGRSGAWRSSRSSGSPIPSPPPPGPTARTCRRT